MLKMMSCGNSKVDSWSVWWRWNEWREYNEMVLVVPRRQD